MLMYLSLMNCLNGMEIILSELFDVDMGVVPILEGEGWAEGKIPVIGTGAGWWDSVIKVLFIEMLI